MDWWVVRLGGWVEVVDRSAGEGCPPLEAGVVPMCTCMFSPPLSLVHAEPWMLDPKPLQHCPAHTGSTQETSSSPSPPRHTTTILFVAIIPVSGWSVPVATQVQELVELWLKAPAPVVKMVHMVVACYK